MHFTLRELLGPLPPISSASASAAPSSAATAAASPSSGILLVFSPGLIDDQISPIYVLSAQLLDSLFRFLLGCHLDETEPPGLSGRTVSDDIDRFHCAGLREQFLERLLGGGIRQVPYIQLLRHGTVPPIQRKGQ